MHGFYTANSIRVPELKIENQQLRELLSKRESELQVQREQHRALMSRIDELEQALDAPVVIHKTGASAVRDFIEEAVEDFPEQAMHLKEASRDFIKAMFPHAPPSPVITQDDDPEGEEVPEVVGQVGVEPAGVDNNPVL